MALERREIWPDSSVTSWTATDIEIPSVLVIACKDRHLPLERLLQFRPALIVWRTAAGRGSAFAALEDEGRQRLYQLLEQKRVREIWLLGHSRCSALSTMSSPPMVGPPASLMERICQRIQQATHDRTVAMRLLAQHAEQLAHDPVVGPQVSEGRIRLVSLFRLDESGEFLVRRDQRPSFEPLPIGSQP